MTEKNTVTTRRTEDEDNETLVLQIQESGAISIPKGERGAEDAYLYEKQDDGTINLTPIKTEYRAVQSDD